MGRGEAGEGWIWCEGRRAQDFGRDKRTNASLDTVSHLDVHFFPHVGRESVCGGGLVRGGEGLKAVGWWCAP